MEDDRARLHLERVAGALRQFVQRTPPQAHGEDPASGFDVVAGRTISSEAQVPGWPDDLHWLASVCRLIEDMVGGYETRGPAAPWCPTEREHYIFRPEGQYWTICYEDEVFRLRDSKGLRYLSWLLRHAEQEVLASDLVVIANGVQCVVSLGLRTDRANGGAIRGGTLGDAGPHLDSRAMGNYRRRLAELREELEEARLFNDAGRCDRIEHEVQWISRQLAAASHYGSAARASSSTERARVNVKNNLTTAMNAIRHFDLDLWRHLFNAVKTGTFCVYAPERKHPWRL